MADRGFLSVKNFKRFQHYKNRSPPWIKLYNDLLDDYDFGRLQDASKMHLVGIWLLASRLDNRIPNDPDWLARRLSATEPVNVAELLNAGFVTVCEDASATLAGCKHDASKVLLQRESRERERVERETTTARARARKPPDPDRDVGNSVAIGPDLHPDLNQQPDRVSGGEILAAWIDQQPARPSPRDAGKFGAACKRLAEEHPAAEIAAAMVGMGQLYPHSNGQPWDPLDLERKFAKALAASQQHPDVQDARAGAEFDRILNERELVR